MGRQKKRHTAHTHLQVWEKRANDYSCHIEIYQQYSLSHYILNITLTNKVKKGKGKVVSMIN